jgi:hypothetical protein
MVLLSAIEIYNKEEYPHSFFLSMEITSNFRVIHVDAGENLNHDAMVPLSDSLISTFTPTLLHYFK